MPTVTRRELTAALLWSAFIVLLTSGPYVIGQSGADGRHYSGLVAAVDDGNVYLQWIRQAAEGRWTLGNQYSADVGADLSFNAFLLGLGRTAALLHLSPPQALAVGRVLSGCFCLVAFYLLASAFSADRTFRWTALLLVSLAGGLGWLLDLLYPASLPPVQPIDYGPRWVYQPEAITFVSILVNPLFAFSLGLICLCLYFVLRAAETACTRWAVAAGVCMLVLGNAHTYDLPVVHGTAVLWLAAAVLSRRLTLGRALLMYGPMAALTLPAALWQWHVLQADPLYRAKAETPTLSGPYANLAAGYGLTWLLALAGVLWLLLGRSPERPRLARLIPWAVLASALPYAPLPVQRKLVEGLQFPLCLLASVAICHALGARLARGSAPEGHVRLRVALAAVVVTLLSLPSNLLFYADCIRNVRTNNADLAGAWMPPVYLEAGDHEAIRELARRCVGREVVLSSTMIGNYIPTLTPCHVVAGHWGESIYLLPTPAGGWERAPYERYAAPAVRSFFSPRTTPGTRARLLLIFRVSYVYCGPIENALYATGVPRPLSSGVPVGPTADAVLAELPFLERVYSARGVSLYRVAPSLELAQFVREN